jgi:CRISPR-associated exonuclease Cas4
MILFRVVDLKQYIFCPRLIYYHYCLPAVRPITYKMEAGLAAQDEEETRAARRSLRAYGLKRGQTETNLPLQSETLGLTGVVDVAITTDDNLQGEPEIIPVDYKLSRRRPGIHFKLQLVAYGLLLAETRQLPANRGFLYAIPLRQAEEVVFKPNLKARLSRALAEMQEIVVAERMPQPAKSRAKCQVCEFRRFCNDVV